MSDHSNDVTLHGYPAVLGSRTASSQECTCLAIDNGRIRWLIVEASCPLHSHSPRTTKQSGEGI